MRKLMNILTIASLLTVIFFSAGCARNSAEAAYPTLPHVCPVVPVTDSYLNSYMAQYSTGTINTGQEVNIQEEPPEKDCAVKIVRLSLGDTFIYQTMKVTLGSTAQLVHYTQTFDFNPERPSSTYWQLKDTLREKAIYIPVTIIDTAECPRLVGRYIWMLINSPYYAPGQYESNHTSWHNPGGEGDAHHFSHGPDIL